jgi:hypothetical protein
MYNTLIHTNVDNQISHLDNTKYTIKQLEQLYKQHPNDIYIIKIINNKLVYNTSLYDPLNRLSKIIIFLENVLKLYKLDNTILGFYIRDSFFWKAKIPVFNWALPDNIYGLIFPHFDMQLFEFDNTNKYDFDKIKTQFNKVKVNKTDKINKIYFKGSSTSKNKTYLRETFKTYNHPFSIKIDTPTEPLTNLKKYKYILDLPGVKPQSLRFKYLFLTNSLPIRISLYNTKFDEQSEWKQYIDTFLIENEDYIHLKYNVDYDNRLSKLQLNKIKHDIVKVYNKLENNHTKYRQIVKSGHDKVKKLVTMKSTYYYIYYIIKQLTAKCIK